MAHIAPRIAKTHSTITISKDDKRSIADVLGCEELSQSSPKKQRVL